MQSHYPGPLSPRGLKFQLCDLVGVGQRILSLSSVFGIYKSEIMILHNVTERINPDHIPRGPSPVLAVISQSLLLLVKHSTKG